MQIQVHSCSEHLVDLEMRSDMGVQFSPAMFLGLSQVVL